MITALMASAWVWLAAAQIPAEPAEAAKPAEPQPQPPKEAAQEAPAKPGHQTVVTASKFERDPYEQPRAVTLISSDDLSKRPARTTPEALLESEGVFLQKTNHGGGAPIVRGLYGQQIVLLVDGVRINNSTVRAGPNQFLNTIDPFLIEQIEVVRGPGSVLWGSDALGGVVAVRTYWPRFKRELTPELGVRLQGMSADSGLQGHLRAGVSLLDTAVSGTISARDFNDLRGGAEVGLQPYTGYEEGDASLKLRQRLGPATELYAQFQAVRQTNAPRLDRSAPGDFRRFSDQFRDLGHARLVSRDFGPFREAEVEVSVHRQGDVTDRFRTPQDRIETDALTVWTTGARMEGDLALDVGPLGKGDLVVGADAFYDRLTSVAFRTAIQDETAITARPQDARYAGAPTALSAGAFALLSGRDDQPLTYRAGVRLQLSSLHLPEDARMNILFASAANPPPVYAAEDQRILGIAAELGLRQRLPLGFQAIVNLGTGFRAPNIDDHLRLGAEGPGFLIPARGLRSEQSFTAEGGLRLVRDRVRAQAFYAYTTIPGLVGNIPTTVNGEATNTDGLPYLLRTNRDGAVIHSVELSVEVKPLEVLTVAGHASYTHGTQTRRDLTAPGEPLISEPLTRTPPLNGVLRVTYEPNQHLFFEGLARAASAQTRLSANDRLDIRICPESRGCTGTPAWTTFHLRGGYRLNENFSASVTAQNLLDATYRAHGSGVDEPGRSVVVGLEGNL